jgi:hypothetical protein
MGVVWIVIVLVALVISSIYMANNQPAPSDVIFTCTTFLSKPNKLENLHVVLERLPLTNIDTFLVVNEYDPESSVDYGVILAEKYPHVKFFQKGKDDAGQAKSLNFILTNIRPYKYWIHWEESWESEFHWIQQAISIMDTNPWITQLQLTPDWLTQRGNSHEGFKEVYVDPAYDSNTKWWDLEKWPLYSLRPSINRVANYAGLGTFDERPEKWPVEFEFDYARNWHASGMRKAVLIPPVAFRQANHVSTYE